MNNKDNELKPCPFCGSKPKPYWDDDTTQSYYNERYNIVCCCIISRVFKQEAIDAWNTRKGE